MIAVYYDEANDAWRKADSQNKNPKYKWYDYCDKMWANSVTVTSANRSTYLSADLGTEIPMNDILTMQVWIPRYKYTVWNYNEDGTKTSEPQEIDIEFEDGVISTGEISCVDSISGTNGSASETCKLKSTNETCTDNACNGKTYTHPAFTFGEKELTGFWVGKFEVSSDINCVAKNYSAVGAGCNLKTIKPIVKPNVTSWRGAMVGIFANNIMAMNDDNNIYGFSNSDDTHMIKNMEWGAVAYLSHSKNGKQVDIEKNSNSNNLTGCGPQSEGSTANGTICNSYDTILGKLSSTTGNIYGVYDMSGGNWDMCMGNMVFSDGVTMISGFDNGNTSYPNRHSNFTGILYNGTSSSYYVGLYEYPENKYIDKYSYGTTYNDSVSKKRSKLGDGIREVYFSGLFLWHGDLGYIMHAGASWSARGSYFTDVETGVFASSYLAGQSYGAHSTRLVISQ